MKPDVEADLGDRAVALTEHEHRALDAPPLQVAVRGLTEGRPERADEVRLRDVRDSRERGNVERPPVVPVHRVACAKHAPVGVFDRGSHRVIVTRVSRCD